MRAAAATRERVPWLPALNSIQPDIITTSILARGSGMTDRPSGRYQCEEKLAYMFPPPRGRPGKEETKTAANHP
jgi:hypothetical protein